VVPNEPNHTVKVATKYNVTDDWSVGATLRAVSKKIGRDNARRLFGLP
jgi:hypothetical protein